MLAFNNTASNTVFAFENSKLRYTIDKVRSGGYTAGFFPVSKGDKANSYYNGTLIANYFRFVYSQGS